MGQKAKKPFEPATNLADAFVSEERREREKLNQAMSAKCSKDCHPLLEYFQKSAYLLPIVTPCTINSSIVEDRLEITYSFGMSGKFVKSFSFDEAAHMGCVIASYLEHMKKGS